MLFLTHLLAAALLGAVRRFSPHYLVVGAALPDLVDKPLASLGPVPVFHSVGHSALLAPVFALVAWRFRYGPSLALGWVSHLLLDAGQIVLNGRPDDARFLGWPLIGPRTPLAIPPGDFFFYYLWSPAFYVEVGLWLLAIVLVAGRLRTGWRPAPGDLRPPGLG